MNVSVLGIGRRCGRVGGHLGLVQHVWGWLGYHYWGLGRHVVHHRRVRNLWLLTHILRLVGSHRVVALVHHLILTHIVVLEVTIWPLVVRPIVDVTLPILMMKVVHLVWHTRSTAPTAIHVVSPALMNSVLVSVKSRPRSILLSPSSASIVEVESWLQKESQKIDEILRTVQALNLSLSLLVLFSLLSFLVEDFFVPDLPHFFWIAVLDIECILLFEKDISGELFCDLALVLLLKVDEGLLRSFHHLDSRDFTLTSCAKIDL